MTDHLRPAFFVIGEQKCGTSSLFRYLTAHPHVLPGRRKEPNFFGSHPPAYIDAHFDDYLAQFPLRHGAANETLFWPDLDPRGRLYESPVHFERVPGCTYITGEASANTFCEVDPALVRRYLPETKLILLLRNPVDRAFSHHRMYQRFQEEGEEGLDPGFTVGEFADDIHRELAAAARGEATPCLSPGVYVNRLRRWVDVWGWPQVRVYRTEDLAEPTTRRAIVADVHAYLALPPFEDQTVARVFNRAPEATMPATTRKQLAAFYRPHNRELEAFLGRPMHWDEPS